MVIGGFPNEFMVYDSIINAKLGDQPAILFAYILAIILLTIFTIQRQLRLRQENLSAYSYTRYDFKYRKYIGKGWWPSPFG